MAEAPPLENKDNKPAPAPSGNDDWKAKYEAEKRAHDVTTQQRNMYKNSAEELTTKVETLGKEKDTIEGELTRVKTESETATKKLAATEKSSEILSKFKDETRELAKDLGLELADAEDEDAVKAFEDKLNKLEGKAPAPAADENTPKPPAPPVSSDNQRLDNAPAPTAKTETEQLKDLENKVADVKF